MRSQQRSPTTKATSAQPATASEVANLLRRIDDETRAAHNALYGLSSGTARHQVISAHMERTQAAASQLIDAIGEDQAIPLIIKAMGQ